ncbi:MAG: hypothetical protein K0R13_2825, partial [Propionibacteriaceae bacterium]|nr:hypothetical protein [Propionibacteriaceae bacterium]
VVHHRVGMSEVDHNLSLFGGSAVISEVKGSNQLQIWGRFDCTTHFVTHPAAGSEDANPCHARHLPTLSGPQQAIARQLLQLLAHRAWSPPPPSSLAEERTPLLPPCGGARFPTLTAEKLQVGFTTGRGSTRFAGPAPGLLRWQVSGDGRRGPRPRRVPARRSRDQNNAAARQGSGRRRGPH